MRCSSLALLLVVPVTGCSESDIHSAPIDVSWMEWPADVLAAVPFAVRLSGVQPGQCMHVVDVVVAQVVDQSAVTFEPHVLFTGPEVGCHSTQPTGVEGFVPIPGRVLDTTVTIAGLDASSPRTFEMRAGTGVGVSAQAQSTLPTRTFGDITVRTGGATDGRRNAGGRALVRPDTTGCLRVRATGLYPGYVLENPPDTTSSWAAFVRGYLYHPAAPVCGDTVAFHLISRN